MNTSSTTVFAVKYEESVGVKGGRGGRDSLGREKTCDSRNIAQSRGSRKCPSEVFSRKFKIKKQVCRLNQQRSAAGSATRKEEATFAGLGFCHSGQTDRCFARCFPGSASGGG